MESKCDFQADFAPQYDLSQPRYVCAMTGEVQHHPNAPFFFHCPCASRSCTAMFPKTTPEFPHGAPSCSTMEICMHGFVGGRGTRCPYHRHYMNLWAAERNKAGQPVNRCAEGAECLNWKIPVYDNRGNLVTVTRRCPFWHEGDLEGALAPARSVAPHSANLVRCRAGAACPFLGKGTCKYVHTEEEVSKAKASASAPKPKVRPCRNFAAGNCTRGASCWFSHN